MRLTRRNAIPTIVAIGPMMLLESRGAFAASDAVEIDRDAAAALRRLYASEHRTVSLGQKAVGILVFPKIVKAGFIFGAQGGKGVLRVHNHIDGYYSIAAGSFGKSLESSKALIVERLISLPSLVPECHRCLRK